LIFLSLDVFVQSVEFRSQPNLVALALSALQDFDINQLHFVTKYPEHIEQPYTISIPDYFKMSSADESNSCDDAFPALSFGIEIELLFAFQEQLIVNVLKRKHPAASVIKNLTRAQQDACRPKQYPRNPYNSWALLNAGTNPTTLRTSVTTPEGEIRAYLDEPMELVSEILAATVEHKINNPVNDGAIPDYSTWNIGSDNSIVALPSSKKAEALDGRIKDPADWDTFGLELISPPHTDISTAEEEVSAILSKLRGTPESTFGILLDDSCGLHVHVGLSDGEALPIRTLQHIAYMLVVYEEQIGLLHDPKRRNRQEEIKSNRKAFLAECPEPVERMVEDEDGNMVVKKFEPLFTPLEEVRRQIFDEVDKSDDPYEALKERIGTERSYIVNFKHINRGSGPRTIEFRQHAASDDPSEIFWWVKFCLGLVQLAMLYEVLGWECPVQDWNDRIDIEDLLDAMGMEDKGKEYYRQKIDRYGAREDCPDRLEYWTEYIDFGDDY